MLGMNCPSCHVTKIKSASAYFDREMKTIGKFCPRCLVFQNFDSEFDKIRDKLIRSNQNTKPKFSRLKKQRMACTYCAKNGIINRKKWTIRKMPKKKDETQHWKCTCKICGKSWGQTTSNEYHLIDPKQTDYVLGF